MFRWINNIFRLFTPTMSRNDQAPSVVDPHYDHDIRILPLGLEALRELDRSTFYEMFTDNDIIDAYEAKSRYEERYGVLHTYRDEEVLKRVLHKN